MAYRRYLAAGSVKGDPYAITAKFGTCKKCKKPMKDQPGYYWPKAKAIYCEDCGHSDYMNFLSAAGDECGMPFAC